MPELEPLPPLPSRAKTAKAKAPAPVPAQAPAQEPDYLPGQDPGDWIPEPEVVLPGLGRPVEPAAATHPGHRQQVATTADLDAQDRAISRRTAQFATPGDALETLRRVRRDLWLLLVQLADLPPSERSAYRAGLQAVIVGCESGIDLVDEAGLAEGA
jgi:hypothetical protein